MKTKLFLVMTLLVSTFYVAQNVKVVSLEACESPNPNNVWCSGVGAYFNLTLANPLLLNCLNTNDYEVEEHTLEDEFSPLPPVTPLNNFYVCSRDFSPYRYISVYVRHLTDPSKSFQGRIRLIIVKKPKLYVNNNSVYVNYTDSSGEVNRTNRQFQFFLDGSSTGVVDYFLSNISSGTHTISYREVYSTGIYSNCTFTETVNITGNFPTNTIKIGASQTICLTEINDAPNTPLTFNLNTYRNLLIGGLDPSLHTVSFLDRDTQTLITNPSSFSSLPDKFVDVIVNRNMTSSSYSGEIKLLKSKVPSITASVSTNNVTLNPSFDGDFLYAIKLVNAPNFGTPQYSPVFSNLPSGNYQARVLNVNTNQNCSSTVNFTINFNCATLSNDVVEIKSFSVYPNPTSGKVSISMENNGDFEIVNIYDIFGKTLDVKANYQTKEVDLSAYPKGVYFLKIKSDSKEDVIKVLKE